MRRLTQGGFFSLLFLIVLLAGCNNTISPEETLTDAEEAIGEVESLEIKFTEKEDHLTESGLLQVNEKDNIQRYEFEELELTIYREDDDMLVEDPDGFVGELDDELLVEEMDGLVGFLTDPYDLLQEFDEDFTDHIEVEQNDDEELVLTYVGDDEEDSDVDEDFAMRYLAFTTFGEEYEDVLEELEEDVEITSASFEMTFDEETKLLKKMKINIKYDEDDDKLKLQHQYTYGKYDEMDDIEALEADEVEDGSESSGLFDDLGDGDDNGANGDVDLDEAGAYVDALIQATIFQDADGFVDAAPQSMSKDSSQEEGELQRDFFKEIYIENTKANMEGTGVTDDEIDDLADAFLGALGKTNYEVVDVEESGADSATVTVSVEGINDSKVYADTDVKLDELIEAEEVTEDNFIEKNMEILTGMYDDVEILDAVEVEVSVVKDGDNYLVPLQDEFLIGGFVQ